MNATPVPPGPPTPPDKSGKKKLWGWTALGILAFIVLVVVVAAVVAPAGGPTASRSVVTSDESRGGLDKDTSQGLTLGEDAGGASESKSYNSPSTVARAGTSDLPEITPRIIKTGKTSLELEKGTFYEKRGDVYFIVDSAGGYIQSENTSEQNEAVRGTFLLRVPFDRFDQAFAGLSELGKVLTVEVASQDVTQEYVDLEGRIRHLESQEQFYLDLIAQAKTIQEMISIREQLDAVQLEKEQALGRRNYLENQTSFSLISLNLAEKPDARPSGTGFWDRVGNAFKSFGRACRELLVGLAYALPYLAVLAVLALVVWMLMRRRKGKAAGDAPTP